MLVFAAICISIVIILGVYILKTIIKEKRSPKPVVIIHGLFALVVIFILSKLVYAGLDDTLVIAALALFIGAALGGLTMAFLSYKKKPIPKAFLIVHPLVGISGFLVLLSYLL